MAYAVQSVLMCLYPADLKSVLLDFDEGVAGEVMSKVRSELQSLSF